MKVLLFPHCFPPAKEGGAITFSNLALGLVQKGIKVEVVTSNCYSTDDFFNPQAKKIPFSKKNWSGVKIDRLSAFPFGRKIFKVLTKVSGNDFFALLAKGPIFLNPGLFLKKRKADWVITGLFPMTSIFWAYLLAKRNKSKLAIIAGFHPKEKEHQNKLLLALLKKSDLIIALTSYEKSLYQKMGISTEKILVLGGITDKLVFDFQKGKRDKFPKRPTVLFLGVKAAHKRISMLIDAMEIVWQKIDVNLVVAGPETLSSPKLKERIKKLKLRDRKQLTYLGRVSQKKKINLIDSATVLVNPSNHESFGYVFIEAWARKKPVIAADIPALKEVVGNKGGLLFQKDSTLDLAEKITSLISNKNFAKIKGQEGWKKANLKFHPDLMIEKITKRLSRKK